MISSSYLPLVQKHLLNTVFLMKLTLDIIDSGNVNNILDISLDSKKHSLSQDLIKDIFNLNRRYI